MFAKVGVIFLHEGCHNFRRGASSNVVVHISTVRKVAEVALWCFDVVFANVHPALRP